MITTEADVCIVGAGAAGGIMALELARRGLHVIVLESGPHHPFEQRADYARRYRRREDPWRTPLPALDRHTSSGAIPNFLAGKRVRGVGGSTLHWEGYALRFHADDFRLHTRHGIAQDWPIGYGELEPYYGAAERALGVAGAPDDPRASRRSTPFALPAFPASYSDTVFAPACRTAGIDMHTLPQARNSVAYGKRAPCRACSTCAVCPTGAKASVDLTHVPDAEATGRVRVVADATVLQLDAEDTGRVRAAIYADHGGTRHRVVARTFVLAAGAVENARLLLLSASARYPGGLANASGLVGKYFMAHPVIEVTARVREKVYPYRIGFSTAMSRQFATGPARSARGGFLMEFLNSAGPTPEQLAATSGLWGAALERRIRDEFGHWLGIRVFAEPLPDRDNAISINSRVRDHFGLPVPHVHWTIAPYERRALDEGRRQAELVFKALGAADLRTTGAMVSGHLIGTHRMGTDPHTSVVDANLRAHDIANLYLVGSGCFVTAGVSPPTLTIAALAIRAAEHIAAQRG